MDQEADASEVEPVALTAVQKTSYYLESRFNLWKRRSIPRYEASASEFKSIEKAAEHCVKHNLEAYMYFQSQVEELESIEQIADYDAKDFYSRVAIERANVYIKARMIRDQELHAPGRQLPMGTLVS